MLLDMQNFSQNAFLGNKPFNTNLLMFVFFESTLRKCV